MAAPQSHLTALITGVTGQDGSYLTELLLSKGYSVHGIMRRGSTFTTERLDHLYADPHEVEGPVRFTLHHGDLGDASALRRVLESVQPDEVYNLGAQSHVRVSFEQPEYTADIGALGALRLLEAVKDYRDRTGHDVRYYQAGTSEMFGTSPPPQSEVSPFHPRSPYAVAKLYAHWQTVNYREAYGMFACNGILFNHESERRGGTFVSRKITRAAARIALGLQERLVLGDLDAQRDWGHARDHVRAMHLMLQADSPDDYVVGTGEMHSVREFVDRAFDYVGMNPDGHVGFDARYLRPAEVPALCGDASKARAVLNWEPEVSFEELVRLMMDHDLGEAQRDRLLFDAGHRMPDRGYATA